MTQFDPASPRIFIAFGAVALCYFGTGAFLWLNKNASLKRSLLPYIGVLLGILFLAVPLVAGFPLQALYTFAPLVAIMVWLNVRAFQFCQACGATVRGSTFAKRPKFCPKCGASLERVAK